MVLLRTLGQGEDVTGYTLPADQTPPARPTPTPSPGLVPWFGGGQVQQAAAPKGGGGGGGYGVGSNFPDFSFGTVPRFTPPKFTLPTFEEATNEPGYKFRAQAGLDALQGAQAAKGLLRTGGSLRDLSNWSQDNAASEYQNVASRSLALQNANYQGAKDAYAPLLAQWSMLNNAELQKQLAIYGRGTIWNNPHGGGGGGGGYINTDPEPMPPI